MSRVAAMSHHCLWCFATVDVTATQSEGVSFGQDNPVETMCPSRNLRTSLSRRMLVQMLSLQSPAGSSWEVILLGEQRQQSVERQSSRVDGPAESRAATRVRL